MVPRIVKMYPVTQFVMRPKVFGILKAIQQERQRGTDVICSKLSKLSDTTYSHGVKIVKELEYFGMIDMPVMKGRVRPITLTEKGERLIKLLIEADELCKNGN